MKDKLSQVREFLLDGIESGRFPPRSKLPGARDIAAEVGASFLLVQHAVSSLEQDGIVECVSRRGTYVCPGWEHRLIRNHMVILKKGIFLPWQNGFADLLAEELPELRLAHNFYRGMFELRVTLYLQEHRDEYLDLSPYLPEGTMMKPAFFSSRSANSENRTGGYSAFPSSSRPGWSSTTGRCSHSADFLIRPATGPGSASWSISGNFVSGSVPTRF